MPQHLLIGFGLLDLEVRGRRFVQKVYSDDLRSGQYWVAKKRIRSKLKSEVI